MSWSHNWARSFIQKINSRIVNYRRKSTRWHLRVWHLGIETYGDLRWKVRMRCSHNLSYVMVSLSTPIFPFCRICPSWFNICKETQPMHPLVIIQLELAKMSVLSHHGYPYLMQIARENYTSTTSYSQICLGIQSLDLSWKIYTKHEEKHDLPLFWVWSPD